MTSLGGSGLSFLGVRGAASCFRTGSHVKPGRGYMQLAPYLTIIPGLAIFIVVLGSNFLGDGLRDVLDLTMRT